MEETLCPGILAVQYVTAVKAKKDGVPFTSRELPHVPGIRRHVSLKRRAEAGTADVNPVVLYEFIGSTCAHVSRTFLSKGLGCDISRDCRSLVPPHAEAGALSAKRIDRRKPKHYCRAAGPRGGVFVLS